MELDFITLDVFTHERFSGNPLAIVNVPRQYHNLLTQSQKQLIAREFNLSETVFLHEFNSITEDDLLHSPSSSSSSTSSPGPAGPSREIDIFTTTAEIPFAGHPTIGTACYLLSTSPPAQLGSVAPNSEGRLRRGTIITKAGHIPVSLNAEGTLAEASIPHNVHIHAAGVPCGDVVGLQPGLRGHNLVADDSFPVVSIVKGMSFVLVELPDEAALAALKAGTPPFNVALDRGWDEGLVGAYYYIKMPNAAADDDDDDDSVSKTQQWLRTRMLEANLEDPATGSAACALACYLSLTSPARESTGGPSMTFDYVVTQGVEMGRKSEIRVKVNMTDCGASGARISKVVLEGGAVSVTRGKIIV